MSRSAIALGLLLVGICSGPVQAQQWATKMFEGTSIDFGNVARGADVEHRFTLRNLYVEDVHISSVSSSCGCTTPRIERDTLKTHESGAIVCTFNTANNLGHKNATITVTIDRPYFAQVQLQVAGYIRSDVVFAPGSVDFGTVAAGTAAERKVTVSYSGRSDWRIVSIKSGSPSITVEAVETSRQYGQVNYQLNVRLSDTAAAGYLDNRVTLVTNDGGAVEIPLAVQGRITAPLTASPSSLFLGVVEPGHQVTKQIVIQGKQPFRITGISSDDGAFQFRPSDEARPVHVVPVTFTAGNTPGHFGYQITITTDLAAQGTCELPAHVQVTAPGVSAGN